MYKSVILIGAGGTGGYLVRDMVRMFANLPILKKPNVYIVDGDKVEEKNISRQNFIYTDIGQNKAEVLAKRYSAAYGYPIVYIPEFLTYDNTYIFTEICRKVGSQDKVLIIDAVDNINARMIIHNYVTQYYTKCCGWLSLGNDEKSGQAFYARRTCYNNVKTIVDYFPHIFSPEALQEELEAQQRISCADRAVSQPQSIAINLMASNIAMNILYSIFYDFNINYNLVTFDIHNKVETSMLGVKVNSLNIHESLSKRGIITDTTFFEKALDYTYEYPFQISDNPTESIRFKVSNILHKEKLVILKEIPENTE